MRHRSWKPCTHADRSASSGRTPVRRLATSSPARCRKSAIAASSAGRSATASSAATSRITRSTGPLESAPRSAVDWRGCPVGRLPHLLHDSRTDSTRVARVVAMFATAQSWDVLGTLISTIDTFRDLNLRSREPVRYGFLADPRLPPSSGGVHGRLLSRPTQAHLDIDDTACRTTAHSVVTRSDESTGGAQPDSEKPTWGHGSASGLGRHPRRGAHERQRLV